MDGQCHILVVACSDHNDHHRKRYDQVDVYLHHGELRLFGLEVSNLLKIDNRVIIQCVEEERGGIKHLIERNKRLFYLDYPLLGHDLVPSSRLIVQGH